MKSGFPPKILRIAAVGLLLQSSLPAETFLFEEPAPNSRVKKLEFGGGTPRQFLTALKETYGGFDSAVTVEDLTEGAPLPPCSLFSDHPHTALTIAMPGRVEISHPSTGWMLLKFLPPSAKAPVNLGKSGSIKDFRFGGGTPLQFVGALDDAFGSSIGKLINISPDAANLALPSFQARTADPIGVIVILQGYSAGHGGKFGNWRVMTADGYSAHQLELTSSVLVTPGDLPLEEATVDTVDGQTPRKGKRDVEAGILDLRLQVVALRRTLAELRQASGVKQPRQVVVPIPTPEVQPLPTEAVQPSGEPKKG